MIAIVMQHREVARRSGFGMSDCRGYNNHQTPSVDTND